ncbi:MAG: hypothetical protein WA160_09385 [Pseudobdellovibrio sp.]
MKTKLILTLAGLALLGLTACNKGDSGGEKDAVIPATPNRIYAVGYNCQTDVNSYCDISPDQLSVTCTNQIQANQASAPLVITTANGNSMCANLQLQSNAYGQSFNQSACSRTAMQAVLSSPTCTAALPLNIPNQNIPNQNIPQFPEIIQPTDPNTRVIQCEFDAARQIQGKWINRNFSTGHIYTSVVVSGNIKQVIDLRRKFIGIDIGDFGNTSMTFNPANLKNGLETITLSNSGLNRSITTSQLGFARQEVRLEAENEDGSMKLMISCTDKTAAKKSTVETSFTSYKCKGTSNLGSSNEVIDLTLPFNKSLLSNEIQLADGLVMNITGDSSGQNNARVVLTASGISSEVTIRSSAYLKSAAQIKINDGFNAVDVTCLPVP